MKPDYDVIIVGGGYAGQAATHGIARLDPGKRVLVIDRRGRAGYPAQSTSGIASYWLDKLGLTPSPDSVSSEIRSFRVFVHGDPPDRQRVLSGPSLAGPGLGVVLQEDDFLGRLERTSAHRGVEFRHSCTVRDAGSHGDSLWVRYGEGDHLTHATARWLFDAGGYDARIARKFGIVRDLEPESFHLGYEITTTDTGALPPDQVGMWVGSWAPSGYIWSFPARFRGRPARRIGVGTPRSVRDERGTVSAKTFFDAWRGVNPGLVGEQLAREGGIIPTYRPRFPLHHHRVLALGDAARLCDPVTGGGIHQALASGIAAAHAVHLTDPGAYDEEMAHYVREMRFRWWMKQAFLSMTDAELRDLFDLFCSFPMPEGEVDPYALRRPLVRHLRRGGFKPLRLLWRSHRLWKALAG